MLLSLRLLLPSLLLMLLSVSHQLSLFVVCSCCSLVLMSVSLFICSFVCSSNLLLHHTYNDNDDNDNANINNSNSNNNNKNYDKRDDRHQ